MFKSVNWGAFLTTITTAFLGGTGLAMQQGHPTTSALGIGLGPALAAGLAFFINPKSGSTPAAPGS